MITTETTTTEPRRELPQGWRWVKLGELICDVEAGKSLLCEERPARLDEWGILKVSAVSWGRFRDFENKVLPPSVLPILKLEVKPGDFLISRANTTELVGAAVLVEGSRSKLLLSDKTLRLILNEELIDKQYLLYVLSSPGARGFIQENATGTSGSMKNISQETIRDIPLPLPPLPEQQRIAALLNEQMAAVERARAAAEARLEAARALPPAYLREAFCGITPLAARKERDQVPPGWKWHRLKDLARLESGHTPSRRRPEWWGGNIPWIALPDIRALDGKIAEQTTEYTNEQGIANSAARVLPASTVVLSRTASVGFVTMMGRPMATSQDFVNWVCGPQLEPHFLAYLLRAARSYIRALGEGAVHKTVYFPTVEAFEVCIPQIPQQKQIVASLDHALLAVEQGYSTLQAQLASIESLPAALLRQAFSGEL